MFYLICLLLTGSLCAGDGDAFFTGNAQFADRLPMSPTGSELYSPYNLANAMGMVYFGAKGETAEQIKQVFSFPGSAEQTVYALGTIQKKWEPLDSLQVANGLFVEKTFSLLPTFRQPLEKTLQAHLQELDFIHDPAGAASHINQWVNEKTEGKIDNLVTRDTIDPMMRLIVVSTLWFKSPWLHPFDPAKTAKAPFYLVDGATKEVEMMEQVEALSYYEENGATAVALPFQNGAELWLILPKEKEWSWETFLSVKQTAERRQIHLFLPKFTLEKAYEMSALLKRLGMPLPFSPSADLSGMAQNRNLHTSAVIHKTFFTLDENGAEAAAATAIGIRTTSLIDPRTQLTLRFDHPFLFALVDRTTGGILFIGSWMGP
ncbi:MAG: serpin family protein [Chlamydiia bacterium]|nr:serpin family protein [Chlamydiia bacterium]